MARSSVLRMWLLINAVALALTTLLSSAVPAEVTQNDGISSVAFGHAPNGEAVELYTLRNRRGMEARIATYGGIVTSLTAPDRADDYADVVLGYDMLAGYLKDSPYLGALIGRYGNRIAHGMFTLDDKTYALAINNGPNSLHGGKVGFDKVVWRVEKAQVSAQGPELTLHYVSRDGEEGYPGDLAVTAVYTLTEDNALRLEHELPVSKCAEDVPCAIRLSLKEYENAWNRRDIQAVVSQYDPSMLAIIGSEYFEYSEYIKRIETMMTHGDPQRVRLEVNTVRVLGHDYALTTGSVHSLSKDGSENSALFSAVYIHRGQRWKFIFAQS